MLLGAMLQGFMPYQLLLASTLLILSLIPGQIAADERPEREFKECAECPQMVAIPAGRFTMGSPSGEAGRFDSEGPQHAVSVRAFALAKFPVRVAEFLDFLQQTGHRPVPCQPTIGLGWSSPGRGAAYPPAGIA